MKFYFLLGKKHVNIISEKKSKQANLKKIKSNMSNKGKNGIPAFVCCKPRDFHPFKNSKLENKQVCSVPECLRMVHGPCEGKQCRFLFCDMHTQHEHYVCYDETCSEFASYIAEDDESDMVACPTHAAGRITQPMPYFPDMSLMEIYNAIMQPGSSCSFTDCPKSSDTNCTKSLCKYTFCAKHADHKHQGCYWGQGCDNYGDASCIAENATYGAVIYCKSHGQRIQAQQNRNRCIDCQRQKASIGNQCGVCFRTSRSAYLRSTQSNCCMM